MFQFTETIIIVFMVCTRNIAEDISCDENNKCQNQIIRCKQFDHCSITCIGNSTCKGTTFDCPPGTYNCGLNCSGPRACMSVAINASQTVGGNLMINVNNCFQAFKNSHTICPKDGNCSISTLKDCTNSNLKQQATMTSSIIDASNTTSGNLKIEMGNYKAGNSGSAWHAGGTVVYCPVNGNCIINCAEGWEACKRTQFIAQPTTNLLSISARGGGALRQAQIICPKKRSHKNCIIDVTGAFGGPLRNMNITAVDSFANVDLYCYSYDNSGTGAWTAGTTCFGVNDRPKMYCLDGVCSLSKITDSEWECVDLDSPCQVPSNIQAGYVNEIQSTIQTWPPFFTSSADESKWGILIEFVLGFVIAFIMS
eukprot:477261_1